MRLRGQPETRRSRYPRIGSSSPTSRWERPVPTWKRRDEEPAGDARVLRGRPSSAHGAGGLSSTLPVLHSGVPDNWEKDAYTAQGPYVKEPFRYLEEVRDELPYRVISLLPVFESSDHFPLYLQNDPHWSDAGHRIAAQAVASALSAYGLLPLNETPRARPKASPTLHLRATWSRCTARNTWQRVMRDRLKRRLGACGCPRASA